jgi:8-oxo-dGTP pyrophosphatase MutT (NUDIX family)
MLFNLNQLANHANRFDTIRDANPRARLLPTNRRKIYGPVGASQNVAKLIYGERIGKLAKLIPVCGAIIFDPTRQRVLLTRRSDNGRWCIPGGAMDPGESASECCAREVLEETGLVVRVGRLVSVYSSPHVIVEYADGNRRQTLLLSFEAEQIGGDLCISDETTEVGYFSPDNLQSMDLMEPSKELVEDALAGQDAAIVH